MRRKGTRRLQFESLENRKLLAGDVNVSVSAGQLFITGDALVNDIELTSTGVPGQFRIASGTYSPTAINGGAGPLIVGGVTSHTFINLGDGNNQLIFNSNPAAISLPGNLRIDMTAGWDALQVRGANNVTVAGEVEVNSGDGVNVMYFERFHVGGSLVMNLGASIDHVTLNSGAVGINVAINTGAEDDTVYMELAVGGNVFINGTGEDELWIADMITPTVIGGGLFVGVADAALNLFNTTIHQGLFVQGSGSLRMGYCDIFGNAEIRLTGGHSTMVITPIAGAPDVQQFGGNLLLELGAAGGAITVDGVNIAGDLVVRGGDSGESVALTNVRAANSISVDTGGGNDSVRVQTGSTEGQAVIFGGAGGDYVSISNFRAGGNLQVDAAAGFDRISITYCVAGTTLSVRSGPDSDQITISVVSARNLWLDSSAGYDAVVIEYSAFDTLFAQLGSEPDSLVLRANRIRIAALLDGGNGHDLFAGAGNLLIGLSLRNIEAR
jgi:hypothetical protein